MSILVATPMYRGQCSEMYFQCALQCAIEAYQGGMEIDWLTLSNESAIHRARNTCASRFLEGDWERLLFIDADIGFTTDDVAALWNAELDVVGGIVPMKKEGTYNTWNDGLMVDPDPSITAPMKVDYCGAAFLMISRRCLEDLADESIVYDAPYIESGEAYSIFEPYVDPERRLLLTEDYAFCDTASEYGYDVHVLRNLRLKHAGMTVYEPPRLDWDVRADD